MRFLKAFLFLLFILALAGGLVYYWVDKYYHSPAGFKETKVFVVEKGRGIGQIARDMEEEGIVRFAVVLTQIAKYEGKTNPKFGEYAFTPDMSLEQILDRMQKGETIIRKIIIPEGKTVVEIFDILKNSEKLKITLDETTLPKEGSLMPSTYYYTYGDSDADILGQMQKAMAQTIDSLWETRAPDLPISSKEEALTLASIVEKETGVDGERGLVASVFTNRLKKGMKLESDPTAVYGITKGAALGRKPGAADVKHENEYNTYIIERLPPTPICNPGIEAIKAVLNPPQSEYLFFVATGTGGHNFAVDYKEHLKNIQSYRSALKAQ